MPVLQVDNLRRAFGNLVAVDGINFAINPGEVYGLLGPNGAGKSTTINMIATLLRPDAGTIRINGVEQSDRDAYRRLLGFVPQEISLSEKLTARENLMLVGRLYDLGGRTLRTRVAEALEQLGLTDRADDFVYAYSGGMKRRLNFAAALLHRPALLLLDEPTAGVDAHARAHLFDCVEQLARDGRAILYTTHYMEEAERLCHRTAIIDRGRILVEGTLDELRQRVATKQDLVIEAPGIEPTQIEQLAGRLGGVPWRLDNGAAHLAVGDTDRALVDSAQAAHNVGLRPSAIRMNRPDLETVFLELTGRGLRD